MSRTAEQIVDEALANHWKERIDAHGAITTGGTAFVVTNTLRREGWLRESPMDLDAVQQVKALTMQRNDALERIATLERDLAAAEKRSSDWHSCAGQRGNERDRLRRELESSKSREASPAMLRVVEAARRLRDKLRRYLSHGECEAALFAAVAALDAPPAAKARYEVVASSGGWKEGGFVRDIGTQELVFGCWRQGHEYYHRNRCEQECRRLNETEGA